LKRKVKDAPQNPLPMKTADMVSLQILPLFISGTPF
jgi:hypothetical protein